MAAIIEEEHDRVVCRSCAESEIQRELFTRTLHCGGVRPCREEVLAELTERFGQFVLGRHFVPYEPDISGQDLGSHARDSFASGQSSHAATRRERQSLAIQRRTPSGRLR